MPSPVQVAPLLRPRVVRPQMAEPHVVEPRRMEPRVVELWAAEPRGVEQRRAEPRAVEPRFVEPWVMEPRVVAPRVVKPRVVEPRRAEPWVVVPRLVEPRVLEPQRAELQRAGPQRTEPQRAEPWVEPQIAEPQRTEPWVVKPQMRSRTPPWRSSGRQQAGEIETPPSAKVAFDAAAPINTHKKRQPQEAIQAELRRLGKENRELRQKLDAQKSDGQQRGEQSASEGYDHPTPDVDDFLAKVPSMELGKSARMAVELAPRAPVRTVWL